MAVKAQLRPRPGDNRLGVIPSEIKASYSHYRNTRKEAFARITEVGRLLIEAKGHVEHGAWNKWVSDNCDFRERSAQLYMKLAEGVDAGFEYANFAELGIVAYVGAYTHDLEIKEREAAGGGDDEPKPKRKTNPWGGQRITGPLARRKGLIHNMIPRLLVRLEDNRIFRIRFQDDWPASFNAIYIWPKHWGFGPNQEAYNWIHIGYCRDDLDEDRFDGVHETNGKQKATRGEVNEMLERLTPEGKLNNLRGTGTYYETESWVIEDRSSFIDILEMWQRSIGLKEPTSDK